MAATGEKTHVNYEIKLLLLTNRSVRSCRCSKGRLMCTRMLCFIKVHTIFFNSMCLQPFLNMFLVNQWFIFVIFSSVAPHRGQPAAKCHPRWQPTRRLAFSCGLGRRRIRTRDCRTTVWRAAIEPPRLPN